MSYKILKVSPDQFDIFFSEDGKAKSAANFSRIRFGQKPTPRTPLYKDIPEDQVFEMWEQELNRIQDASDLKPVSDGYLGDLISYDLSRKEKTGAQGALAPLDERMDDILEYWTYQDKFKDMFGDKGNSIVIDRDIIREMQQELFGITDEFRHYIRPMSTQRVVSLDQYDNKLITNSGCPDFGKRNDPNIIAQAIRDAETGRWKIYPMVLGARSQRGKQRSIFMAPFSLNIREKQFLYPLLEIIRKRKIPFFSAWEGFEEVELGFYKTQMFEKSGTLVQQDYTSMDKYYNSTCNEIVKAVCRDVFQPSHRDEFDEVLDHLRTVNVLISDDKYIAGEHGMPSGSGFTNFAESIVSNYITKYLKYQLDLTDGAQGLGDDLCFGLSNDVDTSAEVENVLSVVSEQAAGLVVEPSKQRIDGITTVYLQRFFDKRIKDGEMVVGCYPSILALNTAMNPERFHDPRKWSGEMETLRWLMILENCKRLPYFSELVNFFIKGDKYRLGLDIPGFFERLPSTYEDAKDIKGFIPSYNQESMDRGILDFDVVKLIRREYAAVA